MAMGRCFLVQDASRHLQLEVVIENLLYSLTDAQWIKHLHVRHAIEKDNARDKFVGMLHLFDRFFMPLLGKRRLVAPIVKEPVMLRSPLILTTPNVRPSTKVMPAVLGEAIPRILRDGHRAAM